MDINEVVSIFGSRVALARAAGVTKQAVSQWRRVPVERVPAVVRASGGALAAWQLRPDKPDLFPPPASMPG